ncbi:MAG TPA: alginate lyase family protein [Steroidobacteraceae bacterium]|nr:alginate lyase family protein [Steroidobacteraceae bacterium]
MSPSEVGFRVGRKIQGTVERAGIGLARPSVPAGQCGKPWLARLPRDFDVERYRRAADRILSGVFDVFSLHGVQLGFPPRWNVDPRTGIEAPLVFGKELNYRDPTLVGDVKYLWEPNRHLELVTLAQAWHLTRDERYAAGCRTMLESWFDQCPYPRGVNWCVSLEHAARLVNWSFAWFLLGGDDATVFEGPEGQAFRARWLESIYRHCHFIPRHWSRHSSANNHLLGEATGLLVGTLTWPLWPESAEWARQARAELEREALAQTFADGVNKEQAIWYHHAVADMMLVAGLVARANGRDFGKEYWGRLEVMLEFIASVMDVGGNVPMIGDADEGVLLRLADTDVFRSLLATGAVLFNRPALRAKSGRFDDKSRWLLGDEAAADFAQIDASKAFPVRRAFPEGGYFILGEDFETPREVRLVADAGPLGYLAIAAHGHADALAFTLSVAGKPILKDPGTFSYSAQPWRRYFRSTAAHNTVVVDDKDQSEYGGSFLWLGHANAVVETFRASGDEQTLAAHHDGYRRLSDPVRHRRTWRYTAGIASLAITDELVCSAAHSVAIHWHFAPECAVVVAGNSVTASRDNVQVILTCYDGLEPVLVKGREEPPLGWHSDGFDLKEVAPTVVFAGQIRGNAILRTRVSIKRG